MKNEKSISTKGDDPTLKELLAQVAETLERTKGCSDSLKKLLSIIPDIPPEKALAVLEQINLRLWMKLDIGGQKKLRALSQLRHTYSNFGDPMKVTGWASEILEQLPEDIPEEKDVIFVKGTLHQLFGFNYPVLHVHFLDESFLSNSGYRLCEGCDAIHLRIHYKDQPQNESARLGMRRFRCNAAGPSVLDLFNGSYERGPGYVLSADMVHGDNAMSRPDSLWIFRKL